MQAPEIFAMTSEALDTVKPCSTGVAYSTIQSSDVNTVEWMGDPEGFVL